MNIKIDKNDQLFSLMIRERNGNKCVWCGKRAEDGWRLTCSHFWGRSDKSNRFNPINCDCLCFSCHDANESNKQGKYRDWKIQQLGIDIYSSLERVHNQGYKKYGAFEKQKLNNILKEQYKNKDHLKKFWSLIW